MTTATQVVERCKLSLAKVTDSREIALREAILILCAMSDPMCSLDKLGLSRPEYAKIAMYQSIANQPFPLTVKQLEVIAHSVCYHRAQLQSIDVYVPSNEEIDALKKERGTGGGAASTLPKVPTLDIRDEEMWLYSPYSMKGRTDTMVYELRQAGMYCHWTNNENKEYKLPMHERAWEIMFKHFNINECKLSANAQRYRAEIERKKAQEKALADSAEQERRRQYFAYLGDIKTEMEGEFAPGKTLYRHQKQAIKMLLHRMRGIIGDEVGLGKTHVALIAAKALQKHHSVDVIIITTVSAAKVWAETALETGVDCSIYSWASIPFLAANAKPFVLIGDEAHYAQHLQSSRTKKFLALALHKQCKAMFALTGTPMPNGRPKGLYPLLVACKHPLVYDEDEAKRAKKLTEYYKVFCGVTKKRISGGRVINDTNGASNLTLLYQITNYRPTSKDNDPHSCLIARLKRDCIDMPPKIRNKTGVSLSARTIRQFEDDVSAMWDKFEQGVAEKVDAYRKEYCERRGITEDQMLPEDHMAVQGKEEEIRTAEAIVKYGIFRHCGAVAKTEAAIELASSILDGHKLVIFTSFIDVAKDIAERIKKETGHETAVISAEVTGKSRDAIREDFQNPEGSIQCIVCTAAAGEAITLTAADYMIIVDRLFRPGDVVQWEGRIDRIGQKQRIVIYWLQLPVNVTNIDDKIDALLEQKQVNIDKAILGKSPDEDTQFEKQNGKTLEALMRETVTRIRNK